MTTGMHSPQLAIFTMNKILMMIMVVAFVGCDEPTITAYDAGADSASFAGSDSRYKSDIISPVYFRSQ